MTASQKLLVAMSSDSSRPRFAPMPRPVNSSTSVSGVLRATVTYTVAVARREPSGATRMAVSSVPSTSEPSALTAVSRTVIQKAARMVPPSVTSASISTARAAGPAAG